MQSDASDEDDSLRLHNGGQADLAWHISLSPTQVSKSTGSLTTGITFLGPSGVTPLSALGVIDIKPPAAPPGGSLLGLLLGKLGTAPGEPAALDHLGIANEQMDKVLQETSKHLRSIGRVNIVVAGQTGVGKSSLINAVFGEEFARTAAGRPVTQQAEWFSSDKLPLRILDTKGLEAKDYAATINDLKAEIELGRSAKDARDQLHIAWLCIAAPSSRIQDAEIDVVRLLNRYEVPVVIALTKYDDDDDFLEVVERVLKERRATCHAIIPVRAVTKKNRPAVGLSEIVLSTFKALPKAHRAAFAASQKVNLDLNREVAADYVTAAAAAAGAAAVIPIPLADVLTIAPIQTGMLVAISNAFGLTLDRTQIVQLLTTVMGCLAVSVAGRWAIGNALKLIPGPGSIIGGALNAGIAGSLTLTLGRVYINFLHGFIQANGRVPLADEIVENFPTYYKARNRDLVNLDMQFATGA
jgi:uncharacterized protein (DUF697 family)/predicted GTPase